MPEYQLDYERGAYYPAIGQRCTMLMPHSEVCMHMRIAGKLMKAELIRSEDGVVRMAQLYTLDDKPFSIPVTFGEAGFYAREDGVMYTYWHKERKL